MQASAKDISDRLGADGYAFANVNAVPELNRDTQTASFTFYVDPGRRAYVRKIPVTAPFFDAKLSDPAEAFAAEADRHPVFRLARSRA